MRALRLHAEVEPRTGNRRRAGAVPEGQAVKAIKRPWWLLDVEEIGVGLYRVESESNDAPWTVDSRLNAGRGECDCPDFRFKWSKFYNGKRVELMRDEKLFFGSCKHTLRVHLFENIRSNLEKIKQDPSANYRGP